jgi:predicted amidohydrolase
LPHGLAGVVVILPSREVTVKVSLVQMNTQDDKSANLKSAKALIEKAVAEEQPDLVVLPE